MDCKSCLEDGVIHVVESHNVTIHGLTCSRSRSRRSAVCLTAVQASIDMAFTLFEDNVGKKGGAVFLNDESNVTLRESSMHGNSATAGGAILVLNGSNIELHNVSFVGNSADFGGAIQAIESTLVLHHTHFEKNTAGGGGGAMYIKVCSVLSLKTKLLQKTIAISMISNVSKRENAIRIKHVGLSRVVTDLSDWETRYFQTVISGIWIAGKPE